MCDQTEGVWNVRKSPAPVGSARSDQISTLYSFLAFFCPGSVWTNCSVLTQSRAPLPTRITRWIEFKWNHIAQRTEGGVVTHTSGAAFEWWREQSADERDQKQPCGFWKRCFIIACYENTAYVGSRVGADRMGNASSFCSTKNTKSEYLFFF